MEESRTPNEEQAQHPKSEEITATHVASGSKRNLVNGRVLRKEKQLRWAAKQERLRQEQEQQQQPATIPTSQEGEFTCEKDSPLKNLAWIQKNSHFCKLVTLNDVERMKSDQVNSYSSLNELLRPYVDLKNCQQPQSHLNERLFIAEGAETVRLLLQHAASNSRNAKEVCNNIQIQSIFVKTFNFFDAGSPLMHEVEQLTVKPPKLFAKDQDDDNVPATECEQPQPPFYVFLGSEDVLSAVAGFPITRGALACGVVPYWDEAWLMAYLDHRRRRCDEANNELPPSQLRLLALDAISDTSNLGSMIRCASAFGVDAIILSSDCCDAWYRRAIRVSMGHAFRVPTVRVGDLKTTITQLSMPPFEVVFFAAVIDLDADVILEKLEQVPNAWCCVLGNEAKGIRPLVAEACHKRVRIDMAVGVDSLSVPIAAGILLHGLREREQNRQIL
jgi:hypothetical protein